MSDDHRVSVNVDSVNVWVTLVLLILLWSLIDPGCVIKVNDTYYNIRIGEQKETK